MKIIIAESEKYGNKEVQVDDDTFDALNKYKWSIVKAGESWGVERYDAKGRPISMGRQILGLSNAKRVSVHELKEGDILIAIDECRMVPGDEKALTVGKRYAILGFTEHDCEDNLIIKDDLGEDHYFCADDYDEFFILAEK